MKLRSFFSVLSGVVLVLLLVGAIGAYWLTASSPAQLPQSASRPAASRLATAPTTGMFISRQATVVVSLLANPEQLESVWLSDARAASRKPLQADLKQLPQSLFSKAGLDYDRDLKDWLGNEIAFAVTTPDVDRDATSGLQPGHLLVLKVENPQLARTALDAFWQRRVGKKVDTEQFAGVELVHAASSAADSTTEKLQPNLTSAIVGEQYVLFANYPKVLRDALNNVQVAELNLESSFTYQQALERFSGEKLGFVFANLAQTNLDQTKQLNQLAGATPESATSYDSLIAVLRPDPNGLLVDTVLLAAQPDQQPLLQPESDVSAMAQFIPAGTRLAVVDKNLEQTWERWSNQLAGLDPSHQPWLSLQQRWGIQMPEVLFDWVKADYAVAQIPGKSQSDWIVVARQGPETAEGVAQLDQLAQQQGASLASFPLEQQTIYAWTKLKTIGNQIGATSLQAVVQGVHTSVGDYELFATSLEALEQALTAHSAANSDFQAAVARLQTPNQGYLLLDREGVKQLLRQLQFVDLPNELFGTLDSAVISSYGSDGTGLRGAVFLHLNHT
jgi:hypothetical protein